MTSRMLSCTKKCLLKTYHQFLLELAALVAPEVQIYKHSSYLYVNEVIHLIPLYSKHAPRNACVCIYEQVRPC